MKNCFLIIFLIIFLSNTAFTQWEACNIGSNLIVLEIKIFENNIFAGTNNGIYLSTDYGIIWNRIDQTGISGAIYALAKNDKNMFAATYYNGIFLSTNNGVTWKSINQGLNEKSLCVVSLAIKDNIIFAGTKGGIYLSTNNGTNWKAVNQGIDSTKLDINKVAICGNNIFAGTVYSGIYLSTDNGNNWNIINEGLPATYITCFATDGKNIYAGTEYGVYLYIENGNYWKEYNHGLTTLFMGALTVSANYIFAGTSDYQYYTGGAFFSSDKGANWKAINQGMKYPCISSIAIDKYNIYAASNGLDNGDVFKAKLLDIGVSVEENISNINSEFNISPNPASDNISISFTNSELSNTSISIFNSLGIEMKRYNSNELTGKNSINISTEVFPSGIYYYSFISGINRITKSFVVVR
jgi:photosystem II stability/assembly factor-like uncharacterized protein